MRLIECGMTGSAELAGGSTWEDLGLSEPWPAVIKALGIAGRPRPIQAELLRGNRLFRPEGNLIISAPTNSGKSLVGLLAMLAAVSDGRRAVLLEPLRAIAREKADELQAAAPQLAKALGRRVKVTVSTGDYELDAEKLSDPPPNQGEIIIATPERMETIIRNPEFDAWVASIGVVVVDEAHLIGSAQRGGRLEYLLTTLLCLPRPPRLILLSATMSGLDRMTEWLQPCEAVVSAERYPPLAVSVGELAADEEASQVICEQAQAILGDPANSLLVFVYQTKSAEQLAAHLNKALGTVTQAQAYHGQMSSAQRQLVREAYSEGRSRCLVTTTALAMGVNLPATHVLVRDITFPGVGQLDAADILQMVGRAGRGDREGQALVLVRPSDEWIPDRLAAALRNQQLPVLVSHFERMVGGSRWGGGQPDLHAVATCVAAHLARYPGLGLSLEELQRFFARSLGGKAILRSLSSALLWLCARSQVLAYKDENGRYHLTVLGQRATMSSIPLPLAAGFAQLVRDLMTLDPTDHLLAEWRPLDQLLVALLMHDRAPSLRRFSADLVGQVDSWMEGAPKEAPVLYQRWIAGQKGSSRAIEVFGSLGITPPRQGAAGDEWARQQAYVALLTALVVHQRSLGVSVQDLERRWKVTGFSGVEERVRDDLVWLLAGIARIFELRTFYHHLKEDCKADKDRIYRVKRLLARKGLMVQRLLGELQYCSLLGPMLQSIRRQRKGAKEPTVGIETIRRLEEAGFRSPADLLAPSVEELVEKAGIKRLYAIQIKAYLARRMR